MEGLVPGRIVYIKEENTISPAMVVKVWSDTCVNLMVFPDSEIPYRRTSVVYDASKEQSYSWHWMFEGQATRHK